MLGKQGGYITSRFLVLFRFDRVLTGWVKVACELERPARSGRPGAKPGTEVDISEFVMAADLAD
jgi:hypothetical protein